MSLYTKSGFSRSFGCCSHWKICDNGKKTCVYQEKDPETMNGCSAWGRNNLPGANTSNPIVYDDEQWDLSPETLEREEIQLINPNVAKEQLTLF